MTTATRRAILGAIACAPAAAILASPLPASKAPESVSPDLTKLIAECTSKHDRFMAESIALEEQHSEAAARAAVECDALPHSTCSHQGQRGQIIWSTDTPANVAVAKSWLKIIDEGKMPSATAEDARQWRSLVDAADARAAAVAEIRTRYRVDELMAECNARFEDAGEALIPVMDFPSANLADVLVKIEYREKHEFGDWAHEDIEADIRRLAGEA